MKKTALFTALMVAVGFTAAAPGSQSFFQDDFFSDSRDDEENDSGLSFDDDFFNSNPSEDGDEDDSSGSDSFFGDDPFFSDEEDSEASDESDTVVEERSVTDAPEPSYVGEDYLSYPNPRNHFLHDQDIHREGSLKVCKILLNQNGEVVDGDTVDATFSVETENMPYEDADNITFDTPLNQVADLVGTSEDLIEGDGYLDAECAEYHDLKLNETYTYDQEEITGADSDEVETVGYIEKWENRNTPISNVESYNSSEDSDGKVRLEPGYNGRHAEVIIVNQINR